MRYSSQSLVKCWRISLRQIWDSSWLQEKPLGQGCCLRIPQKPFFELIVVDFFTLKKLICYDEALFPQIYLTSQKRAAMVSFGLPSELTINLSISSR